MPFVTESLDLAGRLSSTLKVTRCYRGVSSSSLFRLAFYFSHTILKRNRKGDSALKVHNTEAKSPLMLFQVCYGELSCLPHVLFATMI